MTALSVRLAQLTAEQRHAVLDDLSAAELAHLDYYWPLWARADQLPPDPDLWPVWRTWIMLAGRGSGKTRAAAEYVRSEVEAGRHSRIAIVGPTADAIRRDMVEGGSGLLAIAPATFRPQYEPSVRRVVWPNGAVAYLLSSEEPERLRGLNCDLAWADELAAWSNQQATWDMLQLGLRVPGPKGDAPRVVVSTTPKPSPLLKSLLSSPTTVVTRAKTSDNLANLDSGTVAFLTDKYGGTRLGRQELDGELIEDIEGALWQRATLDACRVPTTPDMRRIVIGIDPSGSSHKNSDECGIIVAGIDASRFGWVLGDLSGRMSPDAWARRAVGAFHSWKADRIVVEKNYGGEMCEATIRSVDKRVPIKMVTATRGKAVRAEPIAAFYEQGRIKHACGLTKLEDELCEWCPTDSTLSPGRLDAMVWCMTELMMGPGPMKISDEALRRMGIDPGRVGEPSPGTDGWERRYGIGARWR